MTKLLGPVRWGIVLTVAPLIVRSTNAKAAAAAAAAALKPKP